MSQKTTPIRIFILLTAFLILLASCTKIDSLSQPAGYRELLDIYAQTNEYTSIENDGAKVNIKFRNGVTLTLYQSDMAIEDCTGSTPKIVAWDKDNQWIVAGVSTGIDRDLTLTD